MKTLVKTLLTIVSLTIFPTAAPAKVDLVTLPEREKVQITIYNSADLTLARDTRTLTVRKGENRLQFSWSGTLIDPTSLEMLPAAEAKRIHVQDLLYPPRVTGLGIWNLSSEISGKVPFEITYFTSGVSWQSYYLATLTPDESAMRLEGYVRVNNGSGEDYENAETRLVVGKVNLLDQIAELARREYPYGRPGMEPSVPFPSAEMSGAARGDVRFAKSMMMAPLAAPKRIVKEGLSEYFIYSIEGTEDIRDGWGKRLISFTAPEVPVENLYRYEEERYGPAPVRFVSFANDERHKLGKEPIPGGLVKVFGRVDDAGALSYVGAQETKYIPMGEEVNLNLGPSGQVSVKPTLMERRTDNYEWKDDAVTGYDERLTVRVEAANLRGVPVRIEVRRNFPVNAWEIANSGDFGEHGKVDADTVQYVLSMPPHSRRAFTYDVTLHHGSRGSQ